MSESKGRRVFLGGMGLLGLAGLPKVLLAQNSSPGRPLRLGVLPVSSTRTLLRQYAPVQAYLERALGRSVELVAAADFRTFHLNTQQGEYDLVVTAVHFARLVQMDAGWIPLVRYAALHQTLLLTLRESPLRSLDELRGGVITGPDRLTIISMEGLDWLGARGLRSGVDFSYFEVPTSPAAAQALVNGQSRLALGSPQGLLNMPKALSEQLAVFSAMPERPNLTWLAHPRLAAQQAAIRAALLGLNAPSAGVASFFEATGYQEVRALQAGDLATADRYLPRLRETLKAVR